jgi:hypothetical protein
VSGALEGPYTIDNFALTFGVCVPVGIATQPHSVTVEQCRNTDLTVVASGSGPFLYQWFKGTLPILNATNATYPIVNAQSGDSGTYHVHITGCNLSSADSFQVGVTVNPDVTAPTIVSVLALANGTNYSVDFSDDVLDATTVEATGFRVRPLAGGDDILITSLTINRGTNVLLTTDTPRAPTGNYELIVDPSITDCTGINSIEGGTPDQDGRLAFPMHYEFLLLSIENTPWKYNHEGVDLGLDWRLDPAFDDSSWSNGVSVLDAKSTPRTTVSGLAVMTQLPLHFGTYVTDDLPVYYFRTHFTLPTAKSEVTGLRLRTVIDDFDVAYLNNVDTVVHMRAGNPIADVNSYGYSGGTAVGDGAIEGPFTLDHTLLVDGDNLITAKLFQQALGSSDITFAYELVAVVNTFAPVSTGPTLTIVNNGNGTVNITSSGTTGTLYQADSVTATGAEWQPVAGQSNGSASNVPTGSTQKFYTVRQ